jgi:hypothetical protein
MVVDARYERTVQKAPGWPRVEYASFAVEMRRRDIHSQSLARASAVRMLAWGDYRSRDFVAPPSLLRSFGASAGDGANSARVES